MEPAPLLEPGPRHPYAAMSWRALAAFVHVAPGEVAQWVAEGLPQVAPGLIDPFACSDWLCWGRLDRCPALARRWRTYLLFFAPFLAGQERSRRLQWRRRQHLYLPRPAVQLDWWLARPTAGAHQAVESELPPALAGGTTSDVGGWWRCSGQPEAEPTLDFTTQLRLAPSQVLVPDGDEHQALVALMEEVVAGFRYEYRHHRPWEYCAALTGAGFAAPGAGSCLDCAMALAALLGARSRPWRLVAGVVADSRIANPHFWLEAETTAGWAPLDPTLPAIVRMVGGDWRKAVRAWTGALDARRVTLGVVGPGIAGLPGGSTAGSLMGEAVVDGSNAWPCLDWVCGDCESEFSELA